MTRTDGKREWRCFHCNQVFDDYHAAEGHFGRSPAKPAGCFPYLTYVRNTRALHEALKSAVGHINHMAAFISNLKAGYSFESLGEDIGDIRAALEEADARSK